MRVQVVWVFLLIFHISVQGSPEIIRVSFHYKLNSRDLADCSDYFICVHAHFTCAHRGPGVACATVSLTSCV